MLGIILTGLTFQSGRILTVSISLIPLEHKLSNVPASLRQSLLPQIILIQSFRWRNSRRPSKEGKDSRGCCRKSLAD